MSCSKNKRNVSQQHSYPLDQQILKDTQITSTDSKKIYIGKKKRNQSASSQILSYEELENEEHLNLEESINILQDKMQKRSYSKVVSNQKELMKEENAAAEKQSADLINGSDDDLYEEEHNSEILTDLDALYTEQEDLNSEFNHEDRILFEKWIRPSCETTSGSNKTLAEIILQKLDQVREEKEAISLSPLPISPSLPEKVVLVYQKLGILLSRYKSGKLPKAFKVLPVLVNWPDVLLVTNPDSWTPHAVYQATRLFSSTLKPHQAQLFYESVLLPHVRANLAEHKKLNVYLYEALKKAIYKPSAFFKGIILPLCSVGDCTLREAVIVSSVVSKQSIPVLHSAACLLKLSEMEYSGAISIFIRMLLDKKYSLPQRVISSIVTHFTALQNDSRPCYLLWHQSLLVFVQRYWLFFTNFRYRNSLSKSEKEAIRRLCESKNHEHITPEVFRELATVSEE